MSQSQDKLILHPIRNYLTWDRKRSGTLKLTRQNINEYSNFSKNPLNSLKNRIFFNSCKQNIPLIKISYPELWPHPHTQNPFFHTLKKPQIQVLVMGMRPKDNFLNQVNYANLKFKLPLKFSIDSSPLCIDKLETSVKLGVFYMKLSLT